MVDSAEDLRAALVRDLDLDPGRSWPVEALKEIADAIPDDDLWGLFRRRLHELVAAELNERRWQGAEEFERRLLSELVPFFDLRDRLVVERGLHTEEATRLLIRQCRLGRHQLYGADPGGVYLRLDLAALDERPLGGILLRKPTAILINDVTSDEQGAEGGRASADRGTEVKAGRPPKVTVRLRQIASRRTRDRTSHLRIANGKRQGVNKEVRAIVKALDWNQSPSASTVKAVLYDLYPVE
jgi:hypothetical protein